ncbi:MAG TPA: aromatic ring-opening dioxygenase LigA [Propionibacteriaceae bacterium]|nr:aromatic ring-opening dioxygenase LigA [Propionibacteriaceae bacterium]
MGNTFQRAALYTASPVLITTGAAAWAMITQQLKAQKIEVHKDANQLAGEPVAGPITAMTQAAVIEKHALGMGQGRTFAEISEEWMQATQAGDTARADELAGPRQMIMQANFLRASLFTSVLAYGLAALSVGVGVLSAVVASALPSDD